MKSVTITVGDYDLEIIDQILEQESRFSPQDPRGELMIELMRQIKDNQMIDLGDDDEQTRKVAESRFSSNLGADGKPVVSKQGQYIEPSEVVQMDGDRCAP